MVGKFNQTKHQLIDYLKTTIPEATVEGSWRDDTLWVRNLPYINVLFSPESTWNVYDRNIGESFDGCLADYRFTLHIFHSNCYESGEEKGKYAQNIATRILDSLLPLNTTPASNWWDVSDLTMRESEPYSGTQKISRVIVEGIIQVKRID